MLPKEKTMRFEYLEARSVRQAVSLLLKHQGKAKVIAGGTDLIVQMRRRMKRPQYVIDISRIRQLDYVRRGKNDLRIGALTTMGSLVRSQEVRKRCAVISQAASQVASLGVRNIGTLGGNLCNASPSADTAPILIGLSAIARIEGPEGKKEVPLEDFFTGPGTTVLGAGELLVEVAVPLPRAGTGATYLKHGIRGSIDLSIVGVAAVIALDGDAGPVKEARIVLGAVGSTPMRATKAEGMLMGKAATEDGIALAARAASEESRPITDVRATAEYRREMVEVFTRRALRQALERAKLG
jgi:aerobic carbon-monoxide dehydrogenase medium subunit